MKIIKSILVTLFVTISLVSIANPPSGSGPFGGQDPDNDVPIDGGISVLIAAGAALGIRSLLKKKDK